MTLEEFIGKFQAWMESSASSHLDPAKPRKWCTFDLKDPMVQEELRKLFDRSKLNETYRTRYKEQNQSKQEPYAFIQVELDAMFSAHRSAVARHRSRLSFYRDDCSAKQFRVRSALMVALGRFIVDERRAKAA